MTYITITGTSYYLGPEVFHIGQILTLEKEPHNPYDEEAIRVVSEHGTVYGYAANSINTVAKGTHSAGYIYRDFEQSIHVKVSFILHSSVIAVLME